MARISRPEVSAGRTVSTSGLIEASREASYLAGQEGRIPAVTYVDGGLIGPGSLLWALAVALRGDLDQVKLPTLSELPALASRQDFAELKFRGSWSILPPEFEAPRVIQLAQLQTWSARPTD